MANHATPSPGATPPHPITLAAEAGGYVLTCECGWTRYELARPGADAARHDHAKKCKGPKVEKAKPAPRAPHSVKWDDREGATWIDSM